MTSLRIRSGRSAERLLEPLAAVAGGRHAVVRREAIGEEAAHLRVVLEHEHQARGSRPREPRAPARCAVAAPRPSAARPRRVAVRSAGCAARAPRRAAPDARGSLTWKSAPPLRAVADLDASAVERDQLARDREPETRPAEAARARRRRPGGSARRSPRAARRARPARCPRPRARPRRARARSPTRTRPPSGTNFIAFESRFRRTRSILPGIDRQRQRVRRLDATARRRAPSPRPRRARRCGARRSDQVDLRSIELHPARLELRDVEQVAHVLEQCLRVALDRLEIAPHARPHPRRR